MQAQPGDRLFASLPAVYRDRDGSGDLARLLAAFEALLLGGSGGADPALPGLERMMPAIPALFSPLAGHACEGSVEAEPWRTPDAFLHWLAAWLAFTPHALFPPAALRRILAGIVPMYGRRGTGDYLRRLLQLCFADELAGVQVDDRPRVGFAIGQSSVGVDTWLARSRAFWFRVVVELTEAGAALGPAELERCLRAVIDFAKPAHTAYELQCRPATATGD